MNQASHAVRALLGPDGPLAQELNGYEHRQGQLDMAEAVDRALCEDRILLCEAGTGTGKTLAYLVPALLSGRKVVISTASRALQEQIVHKDLPLVRNTLGLDPEVMLVKGLSNYLCRRRFEELRHDAHAPGANAAMRRALPLIEHWSEQTPRGDRAELDRLEESHPVWSQVTSSSETRLGPKCRYHEQCFVTHMKRRAEQAQILVVNHHLLFADLMIKGDHPGGALPDYDAVILDEAHKIEDVATAFFGTQVSSRQIRRLLAEAQRALRAAGHDDGAHDKLFGAVQRQTDELFAALNVTVDTGEGRAAMPAELWSGALLERYHGLDDALDAVELVLGTATGGDAVAQVAARTRGLRGALSAIVEPTGAQVGWLERREHALTLAASPVDVGEPLRERLFASGRPVVLTSASLTTGSGFSFVRSRLGLLEALDAPVDELEVGSPLDHLRQALIYTPTDLPAVDAPDYAAGAAERVLQLRGMVGGGTFVLCTSLRSMRRFAKALGEKLREPPLVQGEAPKRALLERFRRRDDAVLVATMSFWEGVDVPGRALQLVVLDRIPFAVPTDPVVEARCRAVERAGRSGFMHFSLPQAAITLKQGYGRLLRTRDDHGVVAIFDRRIRERGYGRKLLDTLPPARQTTALDDVKAFVSVHDATGDDW
jgi:ATP-dependent DNA helicase DinG